jgi:hypothetical protein
MRMLGRIKLLLVTIAMKASVFTSFKRSSGVVASMRGLTMVFLLGL